MTILDSYGANSLAYNTSGSRLLYHNDGDIGYLYSVNIDRTDNRELKYLEYLEQRFTFSNKRNIVYYVHRDSDRIHSVDMNTGSEGSITDLFGKYLDVDDDNR